MKDHDRSRGEEGVGLERDASAISAPAPSAPRGEERWRSALETLQDVYFEATLDDVLTFQSPAALKVYGPAAADMIGMHTRDLYVDPARYDEVVATLTAGRPVQDFEAQFHVGGRTLDVSINCRLIVEGKRPIGTNGTVRNITARKSAERELLESQKRFALHIRHVPLGVIQWDTSFCVVAWNPAAERIFGYSSSEALGRHVSDLIAPNENGHDLDQVWQLMLAATGPTRQIRDNVTVDGRAIVCEWFNTPLVDDGGTVIGIASLAQDITETRRVTEERNRILDLSIDMMAAIAQGGEIKRINPAWERTLGYPIDEIVGTNVFRLVHPEDRGLAIRTAMAAERGEAVVDLRVRMLCADESHRWMSWNIAPMENGLTYTVARDITALVEAEKEQLALMRALEETARVLAEQATELDRLRIEAEHLANYDMLTEVRNRRAWFAVAERCPATAVALFDIDHFKTVNDRYGHPAGDTVLQSVAGRLASTLAGYAVVGRIGGEEFAAVFPVPFAEARAACERAIAAISADPIGLGDGRRVEVTLSGGLVPWRRTGGTAADALQATYEEADRALYGAKNAGRQRLVVRGLHAA